MSAAKHAPGPCVLRNPLNGLIWSSHHQRPVTESSGDYTTYTTLERAILVLRRNRDLLNAGFVVEPEPARSCHYGGYAAKLRVFSSDYGRLGGNCADPEWNAWSAGWDARAAIAKATGGAQ